MELSAIADSDQDFIYVGWGSHDGKCKSSPLAQGWKVEVGMDRHAAAVDDAKALREKPDYRTILLGLEGRQLACTCGLNKLCHGDVWVHLFHGLRRKELTPHRRVPATDQEARKAARGWSQSRVKEDVSHRQHPTAIMGHGPPIMVGHRFDRRLFADGAGLCYPGLWPPEKRLAAKGVALKLHAVRLSLVTSVEYRSPTHSSSVAIWVQVTRTAILRRNKPALVFTALPQGP